MSTYTWDFPAERLFRVENVTGYIKEGRTTPLKFRDMTIKGLGIAPISFTPSGLPQADTPVIKKMAGDNPTKGQFGLAYEHFEKKGEKQFGIDLSIALDNWVKFKTIETLLTTYICPLQGTADNDSRIHCSMNINTETGRLSARKPNL
jgi:DNA polymerase-1